MNKYWAHKVPDLFSMAAVTESIDYILTHTKTFTLIILSNASFEAFITCENFMVSKKPQENE